MTAQTYFITGTDTGVGKTHMACALLRHWRAEGLRVCGYKPIASGCVRTPQGLRNDDALALQDAADTDEPYDAINPYAFEPAIAPHLAAAEIGTKIEPSKLNAAHAVLATRYDIVLIEGAGGWQVPLNETQTFADWVGAKQWPVILVVGMRLGCINHALLSAESIQRHSSLLGWIANPLPPTMPMLEANIATLTQRMPVRRLDFTDIPARRVVPADAG